MVLAVVVVLIVLVEMQLVLPAVTVVVVIHGLLPVIHTEAVEAVLVTMVAHPERVAQVAVA